MGYSLVKHMTNSIDDKRVLLYLDRGESDLPHAKVDLYAVGSRAISQSTGQEWFLNSNYEWKPVRDYLGDKFYERNRYGGNAFEIFPDVKGIKTIPEKLTMNVNANAQLFAEEIGDDIVNKKILWEIITAKKNDTYITQDGFLHIGNYTKPAVLTVRATSLSNENIYKDIPVQIDPYGELIGTVYGVNITPNQPTIGAGQSLQLMGTVIGNGSYDKNIIWSISASSDSSISEDGKLEVGEDETYPVIIVTATSCFDNKAVCSMPVVIKKNSETPIIDSVSIIPQTLTIGPGCFASLATIVEGRNDYIPSVKWSVTATSEDTLITQDGILVIGEDEIEGEIQVTATSIVDDAVFDNIVVTVSNAVKPTDKKVIEVVVEPNTMSVYKSYNAMFSAKVVGINVYDQRVNWSVEKNSSDYTSIKSNGSFTMASEEDSNSVIVKATSILDPFAFGMAAVEVLSNKGAGGEVTTVCVANIFINSNDELVALYTDGSQRVIGKISGGETGVYVPSITQSEKILSFKYSKNPGKAPDPVDLNVDVSNFALKTQVVTDEELIAKQDIAGIPEGTVYPANTELKEIVGDLFDYVEPPPPPPEKFILYYGATNNVPTDYSGFTSIEDRTKEDLLANNLVLSIPVVVDPVTEEGQYPVLAVPSSLKLVKWNQAAAPDFPSNSYSTVDKGNYKLYYLTGKVTKTIEYLFTFGEG